MVQNRDNLGFEIVLLLLKGEMHLRGIARELNIPHATVLRKVNVLTGEKVLDYKKEGRNKVFFIKNTLQARNYGYNAERYKLLKLLKAYPDVGVLFEDVLKKTEERVIVLFGSYAKFGAKRDSDIDIYVDTTSRKVKDAIEAVHSRLRVKIGRFDRRSPLIKEIVKNHVIVRGVEEFYEKAKLLGQA